MGVDMSLLNKYKLAKRVYKLEKLISERSIGKGGSPSRAYIIWDYLMNNGPKTISELKSALPKEIVASINFFADNDLLIKNGNTISANADYKWDDVGVIPRTDQQELMNSLKNAQIEEEPDEEPTSVRSTRQRTVKPNLFSRKLEEVKAAVEEGQDVNDYNDKGQTPLIYAVNSRTGDYSDIIAYLLNHGAKATFRYKKRDSFDLACKNHNEAAMLAILKNAPKNDLATMRLPLSIRDNYFIFGEAPESGEIILLVAKADRESSFDDVYHDFYWYAFNYQLISKSQYEEIIDDLINRTNYYIGDHSSCLYEINSGITNTVKGIAKKFGVLWTANYALMNPPKKAAEELIDLYKEAAEGKLKCSQSGGTIIRTIIKLIRLTGRSDSSMNDIILSLPNVIQSLNEYEKELFFTDAVREKNIELLNALATAKVKLSPYIVVSVIYTQESDRDITRLALKILDKKDKRNIRDIFTLEKVAASENRYLIEYFIDLGYGEDLAIACTDDYVQHSDFCKDILKEYDIDLQNPEDKHKNKHKRDGVDRIIDAIISDEWNQSLERFVSNNPDVLRDSEISKAIEDNNTATARQLQRRIDRLPKEDNKYDM